MGIEVVENTTKNPNSPNQNPKLNMGTTPPEIMKFEGNPIYRHTELKLKAFKHMALDTGIQLIQLWLPLS